MDANGLIEKQEIGLEADVRIDTEDIYHHTYQEEVKTMDYIREGNLEEVVGAVELLASTAGKLSENEIRNERNLGDMFDYVGNKSSNRRWGSSCQSV